MKNVVVFDFDGTITTKDSFVELIRYVYGTKLMLFGFFHFAHLLLLMKLRMYPNYKVKQKVFSFFFKGMEQDKFNAHCHNFAKDKSALLRPAAVKALQKAKTSGAEVLVVSASVDNWVQCFLPDVKVLGTQIEVVDGSLTGRFLTKNCYGQEKVNRLLELYPDRREYHLTAYGDSRGDKEMLAFADESYYKPF